MAERPHPFMTDMLATIAQAIGAVSVNSRLAAQNSKQAKEAAEKIGKSRKKLQQQSYGQFDVLSGQVEGDDNAKNITRMLRGQSQSAWEPAESASYDDLTQEPRIPRRRRRRRTKTPSIRPEQVSPPQRSPEDEPIGFMDPETGEWEDTRELEIRETATKERPTRRRYKPNIPFSADPDRHQREVLKDRLKRMMNKPEPVKESSIENELQAMADSEQYQSNQEDEQRRRQSAQNASELNPTSKGSFFEEFQKGWSSVRSPRTQGTRQTGSTLGNIFGGSPNAPQMAGGGIGGSGGEGSGGNGNGIGGEGTIGGIGRLFGAGGAAGGGGGGGGAAAAAGAEGAAGGAAALGAGAATVLPVVGIVVGLGVAAVQVTRSLHEMSQQTIENNRELAKYSGTIQNAIAIYDRQNRILAMRTAQETSGSFQSLAEATTKTNEALQPIESDVTVIKNALLTAFEMGLRELIEAAKVALPELRLLREVARLLRKFAPENTDPALQIALHQITTQKATLTDQQRGRIRVPKPTPEAQRMHNK